MRRLLIILVLICFVIAGAWTAGWFMLADWAGRNVSTVLARLEERGLSVTCSNQSVSGFPFALRIGCGPTSVSERSSGSAANLPGVTGGGSIFAPTTATISLASPVQVRSPLLAEPADFRWEAADIDIGMTLSGPRDIGFDTTDLEAKVAIPDLPGAVVAARSAEGRLSPAEDGGTDAAVTFSGLAVTADGSAFPPVDGRAAASLSVPPRALLAGRAGLRPPLSAEDLDVLLSSGEARLQALGNLAVDAEGVLDGTVTLRIAGANDLPAFIAALPPEHQQLGNAIAGAMFAFGTPTTLEGQPASELLVKIQRGRAQVGPVEVAVPRLAL
jgi:hypothetical protein